MLYRMEKLVGMSISASDGDIGKVKDVYFDDHRWAARYLVVDVGGWLEDRSVLISPFAIERIDWDYRVIHLNLTRQRIKDSPPIDTDKPVSRQHEMEFYNYYGYPDYWSGSMLWGAMPYPLMPAVTSSSANVPLAAGAKPAPADPHLRSAREVTGYRVQATDDSIGHLQDFLIDDQSWGIRYIVIDTRNWWPGKHVVIPPEWIKRLDWAGLTLIVDVTRDAVRDAPEFDPALEFTREYEASLYRHYHRPAYWQ